jgi:hypothetical protein
VRLDSQKDSTSNWLWKKPSMALWIEDSPRSRPVKKPRFSAVDGHRIQCCRTFSTASEECISGRGRSDDCACACRRRVALQPD